MALDQEYFDSIHIDVVKKKYYNANKVEAVFADIRKQAQELMEENARLREQLQGVGDRKAELGEAVFSAQELYRDIIEKAKVVRQEGSGGGSNPGGNNDNGGGGTLVDDPDGD